MFGRKRVLQTVEFYNRPLKHGIVQTTIELRQSKSNTTTLETFCRSIGAVCSQGHSAEICLHICHEKVTWTVCGFNPNHDLFFLKKHIFRNGLSQDKILLPIIITVVIALIQRNITIS